MTTKQAPKDLARQLRERDEMARLKIENELLRQAAEAARRYLNYRLKDPLTKRGRRLRVTRQRALLARIEALMDNTSEQH